MHLSALEGGTVWCSSALDGGTFRCSSALDGGTLQCVGRTEDDDRGSDSTTASLCCAGVAELLSMSRTILATLPPPSLLRSRGRKKDRTVAFLCADWREYRARSVNKHMQHMYSTCTYTIRMLYVSTHTRTVVACVLALFPSLSFVLILNHSPGTRLQFYTYMYVRMHTHIYAQCTF